MDKKKLERIEAVAKEAEKEVEKVDVLDVLLDEENDEPIVLTDDKGKTFTFEQIAVIPYNEKVYCVLKPVDQIEGIQDDEAVVFYVDERPTGSVLIVETDEKTAIAVFDEYYNLLDAAKPKTKKKPSKK